MANTAAMRQLVGHTRLLFFLFLLAVLAVPVNAQATWSPPVTLSPSGRYAFHQDVGIDQSGNSMVVWARRDGTSGCGGSPGCNRIQIVARSVGGTLSTVQDLSPPGLHGMGPQVGVDPSGNAIVAWYGHSQLAFNGECTDCSVLTRARSADGTLSMAQTLAPAGEAYLSGNSGIFPDLGVDQSGNGVFVWEGRDATADCGRGSHRCSIVTRARSATGTLSAPQTLAGASAFGPQVAVAPDGDAVFVWRFHVDNGGCGGFGCDRLQMRVRESPSGQLTATQTLTREDRNAGSARVGVDGAGNAVLSWNSVAGVQTRVRYANGTLSPIQTVGPSSAADLKLAVNQAGDAAFAWIRPDGTTSSGCGSDGCYRIQARVRHADGTLSPIQTLSPPGQDARSPDVGIDQGGNAVLAWERDDGMPAPPCVSSADCVRIQARVRYANGTLSATKTLSAAGVDSVYAQLAVNGAGNAALAWGRLSKPFSRIQAAFGP